MSSGHTGRSGRGNRRARRGSQRPRNPDGQNSQGQSHSSSAMLILSAGARQAPAHAPRDLPTDDGDAMLEEELAPADADGDEDISADVTDALPYARETERGETHETHETHGQRGPAVPAPGGGRGPHERGQPYAPGMRAQPHQAQSPATLRLAANGEGGQRDDDSGAENETDTRPTWGEQESGHDGREMPGVWSRPPRAEREDQRGQHERSDRGEHAPFRPEVRGEVGPLIEALHGLFEQDRVIASQGGTTRCGICYLHFALVDLEYREAEGFYVCRPCARSLGTTRLPMVRRQQRS